ncbi:MAG TPA: hypothetical protein VFB73_14585 [Chloroflexota bacterium]|nr:hypothetical protein [Chloroflexota bacterium]
MWRLLLASILFSGLVWGGTSTAFGLDYEPPVVPAEFLLGPSRGPANPAESRSFTLTVLDSRSLSTAVLDRRGLIVSGPAVAGPHPAEASLQGAGVEWARAGAPGPARFIARNQWSEDRGGCALWNWLSC